MRCGDKFYGPTVQSIVDANNLKPFKNDFWKCDCKNFLGMTKKKKKKYDFDDYIMENEGDTKNKNGI